MGIRSLISGFSLATLVAAGMAVPTVVQADGVKIHLHGHFIGHNYGYKRHHGHRRAHGYRHGHRHRHGIFVPRHDYGYPYWYGRKHHYGHRNQRKFGGQRYRNPGFDARYRKHQRRQARRGFSDVVAPQPRRKRR